MQDIVKNVVFNAPIEKVWNAVATAEGIAAWFMPPNDFQPVIGHEFSLNAGPFGQSPCKITEVEPPNSLAFNWGKDWNLKFELKDLGDKTEFTLIHSGWNAETVTEFGESHEGVREKMAGGWEGMVEHKLRAFVEA